MTADTTRATTAEPSITTSELEELATRLRSEVAEEKPQAHSDSGSDPDSGSGTADSGSPTCEKCGKVENESCLVGLFENAVIGKDEDIYYDYYYPCGECGKLEGGGSTCQNKFTGKLARICWDCGKHKVNEDGKEGGTKLNYSRGGY